MSDKISPVAVVVETLKIFWARKWTYFGLLFLSIVLISLPSFLSLVFQKSAQVVVLAAYLLTLAVMVVTYTTIWHLTITQMRGAGRVFPANLARTCVDVFIRGLVYLLLLLLVMAVMLGPVVALFISVFPQDGAAADVSSMLGVSLLGVVSYAIVAWVALRLSFMPIGAAVGHRMWLKGAWRMSRGYGWRMVASCLIVIAGLVTLSAIPVFGLFFGAKAGVLGLMNVLLLIVFFLLALVSNVVTYALPAVWYEKLRLRQETANPVDEDGPDFGVEAEA